MVFFEEVIAHWIWVPAMVVFVGALMGAIYQVALDAGMFGQENAVVSIVQQQAFMTSGAGATLYPTSTIDGRTNCGATWCYEKIIFSKTGDASGVHFQGWDVIPNASSTSAVIEHFTATAYANGAASGVTVVDTTTFAGEGDPLSFRHVAASGMGSDSNNPVAAVVAAYESTLGALPVDRTINYDTWISGNNGLELDKIDVPGLQLTTGMAIGALPAQNLTVIASYTTPTPLPNISGAMATIYYPSAAATTFAVSMSLYHEPFFTEAATTGGTCASPSPLYVPGSSPTYTATTSFGQTGPWVYPNPDPTSPPNSASGPATFSVSPITAGYCELPVYSVYTPRSGTIWPGMPTPFPQMVDVMGQIALSQLDSTTSPWPSPGPSEIDFAYPGASGDLNGTSYCVAQGDGAVGDCLWAGKTYDNVKLNTYQTDLGAGTGTCKAGGSVAVVADSDKASTTQSSITSSYSTRTINVDGKAAGWCEFEVSSPYAGEPAAGPVVVYVSKAMTAQVDDGNSMSPSTCGSGTYYDLTGATLTVPIDTTGAGWQACNLRVYKTYLKPNSNFVAKITNMTGTDCAHLSGIAIGDTKTSSSNTVGNTQGGNMFYTPAWGVQPTQSDVDCTVTLADATYPSDNTVSLEIVAQKPTLKVRPGGIVTGTAGNSVSKANGHVCGVPTGAQSGAYAIAPVAELATLGLIDASDCYDTSAGPVIVVTEYGFSGQFTPTVSGDNLCPTQFIPSGLIYGPTPAPLGFTNSTSTNLACSVTIAGDANGSPTSAITPVTVVASPTVSPSPPPANCSVTSGVTNIIVGDSCSFDAGQSNDGEYCNAAPNTTGAAPGYTGKNKATVTKGSATVSVSGTTVTVTATGLGAITVDVQSEYVTWTFKTNKNNGVTFCVPHYTWPHTATISAQGVN